MRVSDTGAGASPWPRVDWQVAEEAIRQVRHRSFDWRGNRMTMHHNYYATNAIPPDDTPENLMHDLKRHLELHGITPDERLIERILSRRNITNEDELIRSYPGKPPFQGFMVDYQAEINEGHLP